MLLWLKRGERREKRLYYLAAWVAVALSFMGKGAPGLVLVLFTFVGGVFADVLESKERKMFLVLTVGVVVTQAVLCWASMAWVMPG